MSSCSSEELCTLRLTRLSRHIALTAGTISSLVLGNTAFAQIDSSSNNLQEIVVHGEKTERSLQDTPTSVRVVTNEDIMTENINGFYDVLERTANVTVNDMDSGFKIRGIDAFNVSGGGNSYLTSVYSDGAVLPYRAIQQGGFSTWDVQQVEILRGPQSTLQGRNALAGAIVMDTIDPTWDWDFRGRLGLGEDGRQERATAFGGAIIENQLAFRLSVEDREFDGVFPNITRSHNSDYSEDQTIRAKLLFEPDSLPDLSVMLTLTRAETEIGVHWINRQPGEDPYDYPHTDFNDPTYNYTETDMAVLSIDYELGENWNLTSNTAWSDANYGYEWDGDVSPLPSSILADDRYDKTLSQEFLLNFDYNKVSGVVGAYFFDLDVDDQYYGTRLMSLEDLGAAQLLVAPPEFGGLGLPQAIADQILTLYTPFDPANLYTDTITTQAVNSQAFFADLTWSVTDKLDIFGGIRYDREEQAYESDANISIANADVLPDPANPLFDPSTAMLIAGINQMFFDMANAASGIAPLVDSDFNATLPKLGATWHWSDDISTSFTAQRGYRSGGVGYNTLQGYIYTYDPEYTNNYELSFRSMWLDGRLTANANIFYLDWEDQQVTVQLSNNQFDTETVNSGSSEVKGMELELFYQANRNWSGYAAWGYNETEYTEFLIEQSGITYDLAGRPFASSPRNTFNLGITYRSDSGLLANLNANYQGDASVLNNPYAGGLTEGDPNFDPRNDERTLINLRAGYEWKNVGIYLTVDNLLDEKYIIHPGSDPLTLTIGKPRMVTTRVEVNF